MAVAGFNFAGRGQGSGMAFVNLKPWAERSSTAAELAERAMARFSQIKGGKVLAMLPPAVMELGNAAGLDRLLEDRKGLGHAKLVETRNTLLSREQKKIG